MKIILNSDKKDKINVVEKTLEKFETGQVDIQVFDVKPKKTLTPVNLNVLRNVRNRISALYDYCKEKNIAYDFLVSIESGFEQIDKLYFMNCYASVVLGETNEFLGKSIGLPINSDMFEFVKNENSFNEIISSIDRDNINGDLSSCLTKGFQSNDLYEIMALTNAFYVVGNKDRYSVLTKKIQNNKNK